MGYELTETLYEPEARDGTVVPEGDPRARFLVGVPGQTVPDAEAERLGLHKRKAKAADDDAEPAGKAVRASDVEDKSIRLGGEAKDKGK